LAGWVKAPNSLHAVRRNPYLCEVMNPRVTISGDLWMRVVLQIGAQIVK
jgi:hypothetical protein